MVQRRLFFILAILCVVASRTAVAQDIIFTPINPSFGGSSFNSSHLLSTAEAQKKKAKAAAAARASQSSSDRFVRMLESRLYSSLATAVSEAIFGNTARDNGTIKMGDHEVSFSNDGDAINLTITDFANGKVTNISVPSLGE